MRRILFTILFMFVCVNAHAGYFLSHNNGIIKSRIKSCGAVCSNNPSLLRITEQEYVDSGMSNKKFDVSVVTGSRIVDMTQAEIDAIAQAKDDAQAQSVLDQIDKFEVTNLDLLTALIKRINVRIPSNPITKQEIIDQIKNDKGL